LTLNEKGVKFYQMLEKGNPLERAGRKVTGLSLYGDRVAGLPGSSSIKSSILNKILLK
jgi:hypothetical protein